MTIRKGDVVLVLSGEDRGKQGRVLKLFPNTKRAIVEGVNFIKKHSRPRGVGQQGGIIEKEAPVHISNLRLICPRCGNPSATKTIKLPDGKRARTCKNCNEILER